MNFFVSFGIGLVVLLALLLGATLQLSDALMQADMDRFFWWTRIAVSIAAFPTVLYFSLLSLGGFEPEQ